MVRIATFEDYNFLLNLITTFVEKLFIAMVFSLSLQRKTASLAGKAVFEYKLL